MKLFFWCLLFVLIPFNAFSERKTYNFALPDINGRTYRMRDYCGENARDRRSAIVVSFFMTNCKECIETEIPSLKVIYREFKGSVEIFLISFGENKWAVGDFLSQNPLDFVVLLDTTKKTGGSWGIFGVPYTFIFDGNCRLSERIIGSRIDYLEFLRNKLKEILKNPR